jgi:hypothetical protein
MSYDVEKDVAASFARDVADHRMIVRLDQGLHRHLVFEPREHSWNNRFELITAPGSLTITGDRGDYTFRRLTDMFQFFRSNPDRPHQINVRYWAEKLSDGRRSVQVYSEEVARTHIQESLDTAVADHDALQKEFDEEHERVLADWRADLEFDEAEPLPVKDDEPKELIEARELIEKARETIEDHESWGSGLAYEEAARELLGELEQIGLVSDTWEWDLRDWDFHFVWCLNAIAWGIQQYDTAVRSGLHIVRPPLVAWDTPLPTAAPAGPQRPKAAAATPIKAAVTMKTIQPTEGVL